MHLPFLKAVKKIYWNNENLAVFMATSVVFQSQKWILNE